MKPSIFVLILVVAGAVGLDFYQDWLHVETDMADSKSNVTLSVDWRTIP